MRMRLKDKMAMWFDNSWEKYTRIIWNSKPHYVCCRFCGAELHSKDERYSPVQCGWVELKWPYNLQWVCHGCYGHFEEPYVRKNLEDKP